MLLTFLLTLLMGGMPVTDSSSRPDFEQDTLYLEAGYVSASRPIGTATNSRYNLGQRKILYDDKALDPQRTQSLSDFLKSRTSIYIKEFGNGASAYLSLRGTSSSHTSIDWNGQDLSLPTLGQTDLSHIPLYFFDGLEIHLGGNSTLYGNGSIGGSLQLRTAPRWEKGFSGNVLLRAGSYLSSFTGATLRYSNGKIESKTALFYTGAKNNFSFRNTTKKGHPIERTNNAAYNNYGVLQEVFLRLNPNHLMSAGVYYLDFNRQIQPSVSNNSRPESYTSIYDNNTKTYLGLQGSSPSRHWHYNARLSYSYDYEYYEQDIIAAHRSQASAELEYRRRLISIKAGTLHLYTLPQVHAFAEGVDEWRHEYFATARIYPLDGLSLGGGLRYSTVTDVEVPWLPSFNLQYEWRKNTHLIQLRGAWSRSSKIPTLNDRYWGGTNTHLLPEIADNYEIGVHYHYRSGNWETGADATTYLAQVHDWIRWLPVGEIWRPQNLKEVDSKGVEANVYLKRSFNWGHGQISVDYAYTDVRQVASTRPDDPSLNRQLAYQPYHTLNGSGEISWKAWLLQVDAHFIGSRTTTDRFDHLDPYLLLNATLRYQFVCFRHPSDLSLHINNLLDTQYQNVKFYAMPGINLHVAWMLRF